MTSCERPKESSNGAYSLAFHSRFITALDDRSALIDSNNGTGMMPGSSFVFLIWIPATAASRTTFRMSSSDWVSLTMKCWMAADS